MTAFLQNGSLHSSCEHPMLKPLILPFRVLDGTKGSTIGGSSLLGMDAVKMFQATRHITFHNKFFFLYWYGPALASGHRSRALRADTPPVPYRRPRRFQKVSKAHPSRSDPSVVPAVYPRGSSTGVFTNRPSTTAPHFIRINTFGRFFNFHDASTYYTVEPFSPFPCASFPP